MQQSGFGGSFWAKQTDFRLFLWGQGMWGRRGGAILLAFAVGALSHGPGHASEYLLQPGDVLSLSVVGAPELMRRVPVEMNGMAWFPLIGEIPAAGVSLGDVRQRVAQAFAVTPLHLADAANGASRLARMNEVLVTIEEYRPIYVTGEILAPRAVAFLPGLTVQQALALASVGDGGQRSQYAVGRAMEAAKIELSRAYARVWSLKRLLGTDQPEDHANIFVDGSDAVREIAALEEMVLAAVAAEREHERRVLDERVVRAEARLDALLKQKASEEEGARLDEAIAAQVRELFARRSPQAPASRMAEAQRSALVSASRVLQLEVAAEDVQTELSDLRARLESLDGGRRSELLVQLSDALTQAQLKRSQLAALRYEAAAGVPWEEVLVIINRGGAILPPVRATDAPQDLQPGDILEIVASRPADAS